MLCGIRKANGKTIITLDDDLQHPPESIPILLDKLNDGFDLVYGPPINEKHGLLRDFSSRAYKAILQTFIKGIRVKKISALRVFKTKLRDAPAASAITNAKTIAELKAAWDTDVLGDSPYK